MICFYGKIPNSQAINRPIAHKMFLGMLHLPPFRKYLKACVRQTMIGMPKKLV